MIFLKSKLERDLEKDFLFAIKNYEIIDETENIERVSITYCDFGYKTKKTYFLNSIVFHNKGLFTEIFGFTFVNKKRSGGFFYKNAFDKNGKKIRNAKVMAEYSNGIEKFHTYYKENSKIYKELNNKIKTKVPYSSNFMKS